MKALRRLWIVVPALLLAGVLLWLFATRGTMEELAFLRKNQGGAENSLVDQRTWQTATTVAALAVSAEEQRYASEADRLADHEVDQAFAMALREASMQQRTLSGAALAMSKRVEELKATVHDDQDRVDALTAQQKTSGVPAIEGDDLDVAKAQLGLDQDELTDAVGDLARESGDQRGVIQQELAARNAMQKKLEGTGRDSAVVAAKRYGTLAGRVNAWLEQRSRAALLAQAQNAVETEANKLQARHEDQEQKSDASARNLDAAGAQVVSRARVKVLQQMAGRRVVMSILDDRVETDQQLAAVYARWQTQVWLQHKIVAHLILMSVAWILLIVLLAALLIVLSRWLVSRAENSNKDSRRMQTMDNVIALGIELLALGTVLLVTFGVPQQLTTILGLAGAGLTVVFQDFILAFFGWFVLMGKNGLRVCDWVEIDGVGGEVSEIGLFRTVLLETGNWTSRGHPTGRRVTFTNSYAIRGQYFNYTTHGQWMWDEIKLSLPPGVNGYEIAQKLQAALEEATAAGGAEAEAEWRAATRQNGLSHFSGKPTVDLRPGLTGVDVLVRFMTRANQRFELRQRLYEQMIAMVDAAGKTLDAAKS